MKKINKFLCVLLMVFTLITFTSCSELLEKINNSLPQQEEETESVITISNTLPTSFTTTKDPIDWTKYFKITDSLEGSIEVLESYIDSSNVNQLVPGNYILKISYKNKSKTFSIIFKGNDLTEKEDVKLGKSTITNVTSNYLVITVSYTKVTSCNHYEFKIYNSQSVNCATFTTSGGVATYTLTESGEYTITVQALATASGFKNGDVSTSYAFTVTAKQSGSYTPERETTDTTRLQNVYQADSNYWGVGIPSIGSPKVLVVPVDFSNTTYTTTQLTNLQKAFTGTETETGYESLQSYYYKSSYGKLNLQVEIADTQKINKTASSFERNFNSYDDTDILDQVLKSLDSTYDLSEYDYNKDGFIDGVYIIYNYKIDYDDGEVFWAWTSWRDAYQSNYNTYDGVKANYYMWVSYYFLNEGVATSSYSKYDSNGNTVISGMKINAVTLIHETGHMMGLDDYYDYTDNKGTSGGLGGYDMMDYNEGDHCAYSKIMLGWVNPYIVTDSCTLTLGKFNTTGDAIIIPKDSTNPYFGEYITIEFYTPDGVNRYAGEYVFTVKGVKIMQVDSTLPTVYDYESQFSYTLYDNSESSHALIRYVEPDGKFQIQKTSERHTYTASNDTLYQAGDSFTPGVSGTVFSSMKWYDNTAMKFSVKVDSMSETDVTITITFR